MPSKKILDEQVEKLKNEVTVEGSLLTSLSRYVDTLATLRERIDNDLVEKHRSVEQLIERSNHANEMTRLMHETILSKISDAEKKANTDFADARRISLRLKSIFKGLYTFHEVMKQLDYEIHLIQRQLRILMVKNQALSGSSQKNYAQEVKVLSQKYNEIITAKEKFEKELKELKNVVENDFFS
ncbi:hypothetical protein HYW21_03565 [Candidatus Woesearchaeota archaeon]|nr:hypothetical protein [Candidatus Woesearchaeota archaeon]